MSSLRSDPRCGQALIEWMLMAALAMMAAVWAAGEFAQKAEQAAVQGYARWLQAVAGAVSEALKHADAGTLASTDSSAGMFGQIPVNTLSPVEPWLHRLKQGGWLAGALLAKPSMPYDVKLARIADAGNCRDGQCPINLLLLAIPRARSPAPHPGAMLAALDGHGLAVTDLAPNRLQGSTYQVPNPLAGGTALPVGTVGILAWRADRPPPYVRVNETRRVNLAGGLQLGRLASVDGSCHPDGAVMVGPDGKLRLCRDGRWDEVSERHDHLRACLPLPRRNHLQEALMRMAGLWALFGTEPSCQCPAGFVAFSPGAEGPYMGPVELQYGRACLRL